MRKESPFVKGNVNNPYYSNNAFAPCYHWVDCEKPFLESLEILAPATASNYKQAVYGGADAIYFGYGELNARASADNFTSSLEEVVSFCHLHGVKAYLTLNIALKEEELNEAKAIVREAERVRIDAFIISDLSLIPIIKELSQAQIHASTQLGIHNTQGIIFANEMGFDRVVLSREVDLESLKKIGYNTPIDLEFFVHGALCISFSGACLFSSMITANSGNRGRCNQFCRMMYDGYVDGKKVSSGYLLSAKDICMADRLQDLAVSCVRSCKIEGRLRRSEYTAGVTSFYHSIKTDDEETISDDDVKILFNRGDYTEGYFNGNNVVYPYSPAHIGLKVGNIVRLINPHTGLLSCRQRILDRRDGLKLMRNNTEVSGCTMTGMKDGLYVIYCSELIQKGDSVHITQSKELAERLNNMVKTIPVQAEIRMIGGEKPTVSMRSQWFFVEYTGETELEKAISHPLTEEEIRVQFSKMKGTEFDMEIISVRTENAFATKAQLNTFRRDAVFHLVSYIVSQYEREHAKTVQPFKNSVKCANGDYVEVTNECFITEKVAMYAQKIVYSPTDFTLEGCQSFCKAVKERGLESYIRMPVYIAETDMEKAKTLIPLFDGVICNNVGMIHLAKSMRKKAVAGQNLNIYNRFNPLIGMTDDYFISPELNRNEIRNFQGGILYVYGHLPLMYLSYCPRKQMGLNCQNCDKKVELGDNYGKYPIQTMRFCRGKCTHALKNSVLTDIGNTFKERNFYFDFTESTKEEIDGIMSSYYEKGDYSPIGTNKLHLTRGVK